MGVQTDILTSALDRAAALSSSPPIAWPNVQFQPPATGLWLEAKLFPNETGERFWQSEAPAEYMGFLQILVCFRPNTGIVAPTQQADAIADHFAKGVNLGPVHVRGRASVAPAVIEEGFGYIPVTVQYRGLA